MTSFLSVVPEILGSLSSLDVWLVLIIGTFGGMIIGALPGLSANMGIALMIPFTYKMNPTCAIICLCTIYTSAIAGGSISAILIHTPGTPSSAATALDGYPLTKQGRGLEALGISMLTSALGGLLSGIALLFLSSLLAQFSVKFGSEEYFLLAVFGLSIIASLASENLVKGLISGALGLFLATWGIDAMIGFPRFTFGNIHFYSGIQMVPAMIGLFSMPQVLDQMVVAFRQQRNPVKAEVGAAKGKFFPSWKTFKSLIPTVIRSTIIGISVGILPGAGADVGSWVSYNQAKQASKNKDQFGKGALEGVAASEAANNAVCGGSLIPALTLGIPGSSAAALIMGGLMVHGLFPGAELFTTKAATTYSVMVGFILANIMLYIVGALISRYIIHVTRIPSAIMCAVIVVLSVVGSYAINKSMFDVFTMFVFGFFGYLMNKFDYAPAATVLGLVLGYTAEKGLRQAMSLSDGSNLVMHFMSRPISVFLIIMIIIALSIPLMEKARKAKAAK